MSSQQIEYSVMMALGVLATLMGTGRLPMGGDRAAVERGKKTMRWVGPMLLAIGALLLASTYLRSPT